MYLEAIGELKYQMNISGGIAIEKVMIFEKQEDLIKELEKLKNLHGNEKTFYEWVKENIKIACFCKIEITE